MKATFMGLSGKLVLQELHWGCWGSI